MTDRDIVERLRARRTATRWARGLDTDYATSWEPDALCLEAADEIERLRNPPATVPPLPNLMPVIAWLENGCDPKEAAKELRVYQAQIHGISAAREPSNG